MTTHEFDELAGRLEGLSRAVLLLATEMEEETTMDGLTLTRRWRDSVPQDAASGSLRTARNTLHQLAQALDDARSRRQQLLAAKRLADPELLQRTKAR